MRVNLVVVGDPRWQPAIISDGQAIDLAEPVLDGRHHQVAHVLAGDAAGSGQEAHGFPITAVERKRNPYRTASRSSRRLRTKRRT